MKKVLALCFGLISTVQAATIAVIDSGLDTKHEMIQPNLWVNRNMSFTGSYAGALHGWNFAEKNNQIIDMSLLATFSPDVKKYYDLKAQAFLFSVSPADKLWMNEKLMDRGFVDQLNRFGTFVHGTHVSGIAIRSSNNKAMGIKLLKTNVKAMLDKVTRNTKSAEAINADPWKSIEDIIAYLALGQTANLTEIAKFIHANGARVANGSFGTSYENYSILGQVIAEKFLERKATALEIERAAKMLVTTMTAAGRGFVNAAPNTLFVFAAGNDSSNNDEFGSFPTNIKTPNTISVAATFEDKFLAPFSNYGINMVEVAAPGMMIRSAIPGNEYLRVSGTSQAAPFVANVAGKVKDTNFRLTPAQIKKIIMETVDKKSFLTIRVKSGGIVNPERALLAAEMSNSVSLEEAIVRANNQIPQRPEVKSTSIIPKNVDVLPMPSMFE